MNDNIVIGLSSPLLLHPPLPLLTGLLMQREDTEIVRSPFAYEWYKQDLADYGPYNHTCTFLLSCLGYSGQQWKQFLVSSLSLALELLHGLWIPSPVPFPCCPLHERWSQMSAIIHLSYKPSPSVSLERHWVSKACMTDAPQLHTRWPLLLRHLSTPGVRSGVK